MPSSSKSKGPTGNGVGMGRRIRSRHGRIGSILALTIAVAGVWVMAGGSSSIAGPAEIDPFCIAIPSAGPGEERAAGPWRATCHQAGSVITELDDIYAVCRQTDEGGWAFAGWWQREGGEALIIDRNNAAHCVWVRTKDAQ